MMHLLYKPLKKGTLILTALTTLLILSTALAVAQSDSRVYLQSTQGPDNTLIVDVMVENVTDLYGAEFKLDFDPAVMSVQDVDLQQEGIQIETGAFLPANQGFVVVNKVDSVVGTVSYALTLLKPAPAVSGSGPLARVTFNIEQELPSTIQIEKAKLVAVDLQTIPVEVFALNVGGGEADVVAAEQAAEAAASVSDNQPQPQPETNAPVQPEAQTQVEPPPQLEVQPQAAPPSESQTQPVANSDSMSPAPANGAMPGSEFPWWIIALAILVTGFVSLGVFAIAGGMKNPQQSRPAHSPPHFYQQRHATGQKIQHAQPRKHVTGTRPSAFRE